MVFKMGELFCGPGGLAWGAVHADIGNPDFRIEHAWANDFDASTCETYRHNICPEDPESVYCEDVRKLDLDHFSEILVSFHTSVWSYLEALLSTFPRCL